jgi:hypothetical protein
LEIGFKRPGNGRLFDAREASREASRDKTTCVWPVRYRDKGTKGLQVSEIGDSRFFSVCFCCANERATGDRWYFVSSQKDGRPVAAYVWAGAVLFLLRKLQHSFESFSHTELTA